MNVSKRWMSLVWVCDMSTQINSLELSGLETVWAVGESRVAWLLWGQAGEERPVKAGQLAEGRSLSLAAR